MQRAAARKAARRYGLPETTVKQYYDRKNAPSVVFLIRMAEVEGLSLRWLITGQGPRKADPEAEAAAATITALPPLQRDLALAMIAGAASTVDGENSARGRSVSS